MQGLLASHCEGVGLTGNWVDESGHIATPGAQVPTGVSHTYVPQAQYGNWVRGSYGWWWREANGSYPRFCWKMISGSWYYFDGSGYMQSGCQRINGSWYWLGYDGAMRDGWQKVDGSWYYLSGSGAMVTGWRNLGGTWYWLDASGAMAHDRWVGNYYLASSGAMATCQWIGEYWVGADGCWVPGASRYDTSAHQHSWATRTVTESAAWDEQVLVRVAYDEGVYDGEEIVFSDGHVCQTTKEAADYEEQQYLAGNYVSYSVKRKTRLVHYDAEYKTVHHDAVTRTETYCTICGLIW